MASNDWKKKNYNSSVKVSSKTIADLKAGGTFSANVAKYKSGATAEQREAMNRFYGKSRVDSALGKSVSSVNKTYSVSPGPTFNGVGGAGYKRPTGSTTPVSKPKGNNAVSTFVKNELLGVDDFKNVAKHAKSGNWAGAAKSLATGAFEAGSTAAAVAGSVLTGGAAGGAYVAAKTAQVAARQGVKQAVKQTGKHAAKGTAKTVASKAALATGKGAVKAAKTVATGSMKTGTKNVVKAPVSAVKTAGKGISAVKKAGSTSPRLMAAEKQAARTAKTAATATDKAKEVKASYNALKASGAGKPVKGINKAYDARKAATTGAREARVVAGRSEARVTALKKEYAKKLATGKAVRKGARRAQYAHLTVMANEKNKRK